MHPLGGTEVYLDGAVRCREQLMRDNPGPRAVLNALERLSDGYEGDIRHLKAEIGVKEGQLGDYKARLGAEFQHAEYQSQLADLRDRLKLGLSEKPPEGGEPVTEIAEKIKALRSSNEVEAAPVRTGTRKVTRAEQPVTARIRERRAVEPQAEEQPLIAQSVPEIVEAEEPIKLQPIPAITIDMPLPDKPAIDYRENISSRRKGHNAQLRLF